MCRLPGIPVPTCRYGRKHCRTLSEDSENFKVAFSSCLPAQNGAVSRALTCPRASGKGWAHSCAHPLPVSNRAGGPGRCWSGERPLLVGTPVALP